MESNEITCKSGTAEIFLPQAKKRKEVICVPGTEPLGDSQRPCFDGQTEKEIFLGALRHIHSKNASALKSFLIACFGKQSLSYGAVAKEIVNSGFGKCQRTLLMEASIASCPKCIEVLVGDFECLVNFQNRQTGNTALHEACLHGDEISVFPLLKLGADPSIRNFDNETAEDAAHKNNQNRSRAIISALRKFSKNPVFVPDFHLRCYPDVCTENIMYAFKRKRRIGAYSDLLGVNKGAIAEEDPFINTPMASYISQGLASGRDPFQPESGISEYRKDHWQLAYIEKYEEALSNYQQQYMDSQRNDSSILPNSYRLVVKSSNSVQPGREWNLPVGSDWLIGRNKNECNIVIKEIMVSKKHARIIITPSGAAIYDLKAKHGVTVAVRKPGETGPLVTRYPVPVPTEGLSLMDNDEIVIGETVLVVYRNKLSKGKGASPVQPSTVQPPSIRGQKTMQKPRNQGSVISKGFQVNSNFIEAVMRAQDRMDVAPTKPKDNGLMKSASGSSQFSHAPASKSIVRKPKTTIKKL